jgi:hypothetical protein
LRGLSLSKKPLDENEYQPILKVFENQDPEVTYLSVEDDESGQDEIIVTTPGHPFYLEVNVDNSDRPAPEGHEDLNKRWVGAGDLKLGDKIRQADGTSGTVKIVKTIEQERTMYNLDVATLDNFYVGEQGWLVHNTKPCIAASWTGLNWYRKGGDMTAMEHIIYRHGPNTGFEDVSKFATGTGAREIKSYVDEALALGSPVAKKPNEYEITYDFGSKVIGLDEGGNATTKLIVYVRDGKIQTAFPY